jgi:hypothetical protein
VVTCSLKVCPSHTHPPAVQFIASFRGSNRCGACSPCGYEGYLIPCSSLAARLCASAHIAAEDRHKRSVPANIGKLDLMVAVVHNRTKEDQQRAQRLNARLKNDTTWAEKRKRCGLSALVATLPRPCTCCVPSTAVVRMGHHDPFEVETRRQVLQCLGMPAWQRDTRPILCSHARTVSPTACIRATMQCVFASGAVQPSPPRLQSNAITCW